MYLLIDIGGTKLRLGSSLGLSEVVSVEIHPTPANIESLIEIIKSYLSKYNIADLKAIGIGFAGTLDIQRTKVVSAPHLRSWEGSEIVKVLKESLGVEVFLENDTSLVGLGEVYFGAGSKSQVCVYMTISTGVGGTRIVNGVIDENVYGFEPGHQIVNALKTNLHIDSYEFKAYKGELEEYVSGSGIRKQTGQNPESISDINFWRGIADLLVVGLINTSLYWSPDQIILGGSLITQSAIPFEYLKSKFEEDLEIFAKDPKLVKASLKDIGGLYGALILINQKLNLNA